MANTHVKEVYGWVKRSRRSLLEYCQELPAEVFVQGRDDFGLGSIRNAMVHIADCYRYWLAETYYRREVPRFDPATYPDAAGVARLFSDFVDPLVDEFLAGDADAFTKPAELAVSWSDGPFVVSPLWLLTHTITHEFHHKGQITAYGRVLGHPAPDTDLMEPGA